jgi:hypothetical protein
VAAHFAATGQRPRDCWQMYAKTAILLAAFASLYAVLVFGARTWVEGVPLAVLLGLCAPVSDSTCSTTAAIVRIHLRRGSTGSWP